MDRRKFYYTFDDGHKFWVWISTPDEPDHDEVRRELTKLRGELDRLNLNYNQSDNYIGN